MNDPRERRATYEGILALPENLVRGILHGVLHTHLRPAPKLVRACSSLGGSVGSAHDWGSGGPDGW